MPYQAKNPDPGKQGTNIDEKKYHQIHDAMIGALLQQKHMSLKELVLAVKSQLDGDFDGSFEWYITTVKLDMEARGELVCDRKKSPHLHSLV